MGISRIEWLRSPDGRLGYSINPVKGLCPMACSYCYARRMYKRFKWNPEIRYDGQHHLPLDKLTKPSRIFMGSTMELFGDWVKPEWMLDIMATPKSYPQHTFIFLTKQPQNLAKWDFPENCWVGVTATARRSFNIAIGNLAKIKATVRFISFEPLLNSCQHPALPYLQAVFKEGNLDWVILGAETPYSPKTAPKVEWIREIVEAADEAGIPVFLKHNLWNLLYEKAWDDDIFWANEKATLRQEFPK